MAYADTIDLDALVQGEIPFATAALLLDLVADEIDLGAGRPLAETARVETFDGPGASTLWLDWPLSEVTSVKVDGITLTADGGYTWSRSGWLTRIGDVWAAGSVIEVAYTSGFPAGAPELGVARRVSLEIAARVAANPQALESLTADGVSATFGLGLGLDDAQKADIRRFTSRRRVA